MEEEVKKLREAGFSDEDIRAYMQEQQSGGAATSSAAPISPEQAANGEPVRADETVPDYGGTIAPSFTETLGTAATAAAPYAVPAIVGGTALYGGSVAKKGFDAMKASANARTAQANAQMAATQGLQQRFEAREAARVAAQAAKAPGMPASQILDAQGRPMQAPPATQPRAMTAPAAAPAAPVVGGPAAQQGADFINRITKQFAPMAAKVAPVLSGLNRALPAAQIGTGLFYTSPEEIATLKAAEERRRRLGQ